MKIVARQLLVASCVFGLLVAGAHAQDPTFSLMVTAVNGEDLKAPASSVEVVPGDIVRVVIVLKDWSEPKGKRLRGYEATIAYEGYVSGCAGDVLPVGFGETTDPGGVCPDGNPGGSPNGNAFIDNAHMVPDFVYLGNPLVVFVTDSVSCSYRFDSAVFFPDDAPTSELGVWYYCGTVDLEVSEDAAGEFTLGLDKDGVLLRDENSIEILPIALETLDITVIGGAGGPVSSDPPNGAIDARIPSHSTDCAMEFGWDSIDIVFDCAAAGVQASDFTITVFPDDTTPPVVDGISTAGNVATLSFDMAIPLSHWTIVTYDPTGFSTVLGYLPADVNSSAASNSADVLDLIDFLNGVPPPLEIWQVDVNRSGVANSADILDEIDVLNGAGDCWDPWNGAVLLPIP